MAGGWAKDGAVQEQIEAVKESAPAGDLNAMLRRGRTWTVAES